MNRTQRWMIAGLTAVVLLVAAALALTLRVRLPAADPPPTVAASVAVPRPFNPPPPPADRRVIRFESSATAAERAAYLAAIGATVRDEIAALDAVVVDLPGDAPPALDPAPRVAAAEPDYYAAALNIPDDPLYADQWALPVIGAPEAWAALPAAAAPVTVAVIDSGICADHPDLAGRILPGHDFVERDATPQDAFGHGCAVAGIIAANAGDGWGMAGAAPGVQILPLRVLDATGIGLYSDLAAAIVYAVDAGADLINLSAGGLYDSATLAAAVDYAVAAGVPVIAAAGNTGGGARFPARYPPVIAVGASDPANRAAAFSSAEVDVWGPGVDILSLTPDGGHSRFSGTSFAAPHVAAVAALEQALGGSLRLGGIVRASAAGDLIALEGAPVPDAAGAARARFIVDLALPTQPEADLSGAALTAQRETIAGAQAALLTALAAEGVTVHAQTIFVTVPGLAVEIDAADADRLRSAPGVLAITPDLPRPTLTASANVVIQAPQAWAAGFNGAGQAVAVLDTGVAFNHPALSGRRLDEACFSTASSFYGSTSACPNNQSTQYGAGASMPRSCVGCDHGTHVAGIAAGNGAGRGGSHESFRGAAPGAGLSGINIFSIFNSATWCGAAMPCTLSFDSDQIRGMEHIYNLRGTYAIASVNLSLGSSNIYSTPTACANDFSASYKNVIANLRAAQIAVIAASGNAGQTGGISGPACLPDVISVGATWDSDTVASFSNSASYLDLLAPGVNITSTLPGSGYGGMGGTSMSTPYVAGAWAVLRGAYPGYSVAQILDLLRSTGRPITDTRNGVTKPRINLFGALQSASGTVRFSAPSSAAAEDDSVYAVAVELHITEGQISMPSPLTVTVSYGGTAARGADYTAPDTLTFTRAGGFPIGTYAASLPVTVLRDAIIDADETIIITLTGTSNARATLTAPLTHTVSITDTNVQATGTLGFETGGADVPEHVGIYEAAVLLRVVDGPPNIGTTRFDVPLTTGGTAQAGVDYSAPAFVIFEHAPDFGAGVYRAVVPVTIIDRPGFHGPRTLTLTLQAPGVSFITLGGGTTHTLTLFDVMGETFTENQLYAALERQIQTNPAITYLRFALPDVDGGSLLLTLRGADGVVGVARVSMAVGDGLISSQITSLTVNGATPPAGFTAAIERELPLLLAAAVHDLFSGAMGPQYRLLEILPGGASLRAVFVE